MPVLRPVRPVFASACLALAGLAISSPTQAKPKAKPTAKPFPTSKKPQPQTKSTSKPFPTSKKPKPKPQTKPTSKPFPTSKKPTPTSKKPTPTSTAKPGTKLPKGPGGAFPTQPLPGGTHVPRPDLKLDNWGFERGLSNWTKTGSAFNDQPTLGDNVAAHRIKNGSTGQSMPLGGDYWRDVTFPVGHKGTRWIGTYEKRPNNSVAPGTVAGDGRTGTLTSISFKAEKNYISFLIGGGKDNANLKVELLEKSNSGKAGITMPDGKYKVVSGTRKTGHGNELMRREWWKVTALKGKTLRIRITDNATGGWGHINVDDFVFQDTKPSLAKVKVGKKWVNQVKPHVFKPAPGAVLGFVDWDSPVWGIADLHTHPASHLGFGKQLMFGAPDGPIRTALANCNCMHGGWGIDNTCGNYIRMAVITMTDGMYKHTADLDHPHRGAPKFQHWPHFTTITHQQMRYEWIKRAHEGGLRVMVGLAVNNHLLAEVLDGKNPKDDKASADLQLKYMKEFVGRHRDFMEIAYNPAEMRDIVRRGKLAVVLGIEVDNIGNFNFATINATNAAIKAEVQRLYSLGVRYAFPVHVSDNTFGGAAVYEDMFNYANRFANTQPLPPGLGAALPGTSFRIEHAPDPLIDKRMGLPLENVFAVGIRGGLEAIESMPSPLGVVPMKAFLESEREYKVLKSFFLTPDPATEVWRTIPGGHRNKKGLTTKGEVAIREMMRLGMLIDIDHMSERAVQKTLSIAEGVNGGYPLVSGHNTPRAMRAKGHGTENQRTDRQLERLMSLGGMMGVGWGYDKDKGQTPSFSTAINKSGGRGWTHSNIANSCGGSSRRFANNYLYTLEKMGGAGVALGTDINGLVVPPGPRFGADSRLDGNRCSGQGRPVTYDRGSSGAANNAPLRRGSTLRRTWNINNDGVAHYGMLPDFLQDLDNVGLDPRDMTPLFNSAEDFARMWVQALQRAPS